MAQLSDRLNRLAPSQTLAMSQKSNEMKAQGVDVINMSVGEPDFNTPEPIKEAAKKAIDDNFSRYSPVPGYVDLRKAIVAKLKKENNLDYTTDEVLVSNGAKRMLILCSPSNPTGSVYSKDELEALAEVIKKHEGMYVLADEIYEHINYIGKHESIAQFEGMKERSIIVNGVSKAYAMTGWRIGFIAAPQWIVKGCNKLQGQYTSGPCSVSQKAAEAAYTLPQDCVETMRQAFERRRDLIVSLAKEIPGLEVNKPEGAFYLFPKCSSFFGKTDGQRTINNSTDFAMYLLEVGHVATVGGDAFGDPDCFRMSYATSDDNIKEAMSRIKNALSLLK